MKENYLLETNGFIMKEEVISSINTHIIPGTLVFEDLEQYPGYHGRDIPSGSVPGHIFLALKQQYSTEQLIRTTQNIQKIYPHEFSMTISDVEVGHDAYNCIRLKKLEKYEQIEELQTYYKDLEIEFLKRGKKYNQNALIKLYKIFMLEQVTELIYKDLEVENIHYLQIPKTTNWKLFVKITEIVKSNLNNYKFDAALGGLYRFSGLIDVIRVYGNLSTEQMEKCREKYVELLKKYEFE
jgi:hypothetical protein